MTDRPMVHCPCCGKIHRATVAVSEGVANAYDNLLATLDEFKEVIKVLEEDPEDVQND